LASICTLPPWPKPLYWYTAKSINPIKEGTYLAFVMSAGRFPSP
jgi:hypothetical protein